MKFNGCIKSMIESTVRVQKFILLGKSVVFILVVLISRYIVSFVSSNVLLILISSSVKLGEESNLNASERNDLISLKEDPSIIIAAADKGRTAVHQ